MNEHPIKKILFLAANPLDTVRLKLDREVEEIRSVLSSSSDRFEIEYRGGVRSSELQQHMYDVKPWIVHFAGHGQGNTSGDDGLSSSRKLKAIDSVNSPEGLVFEDEDGRSQLVSAKALANLIDLFRKYVQCVVLNACYSERQAQEIVKYVPYVVGMRREIGDLAARKFSQGFYRAIGDGRSIEEAFRSGKNAIELEGIPEELTPVLLTRSTTSNPVTDESISVPETSQARQEYLKERIQSSIECEIFDGEKIKVQGKDSGLKTGNE